MCPSCLFVVVFVAPVELFLSLVAQMDEWIFWVVVGTNESGKSFPWWTGFPDATTDRRAIRLNALSVVRKAGARSNGTRVTARRLFLAHILSSFGVASLATSEEEKRGQQDKQQIHQTDSAQHDTRQAISSTIVVTSCCCQYTDPTKHPTKQQTTTDSTNHCINQSS